MLSKLTACALGRQIPEKLVVWPAGREMAGDSCAGAWGCNLECGGPDAWRSGRAAEGQALLAVWLAKGPG